MVKTSKTKSNIIRWLDVIVAVMILSNIGAMVLTNAMVAKQPNVRIAESNTVRADVEGYEKHPNAWLNVAKFMMRYGFIAVLFAVYVWMRQTVTSYRMLRNMTFFYGTVAIVFLFDFFNNFGYWIGKQWL